MIRRKQKPYNNNNQRGGHRSGGGRRFNNKRQQKTFEGKTKQQALQGRDKYMNMAQDALSGGDRVEAERYFQYADHFVRIVDYFEEEERKYQEEQEAQSQDWDDDAEGENDSDDDADDKAASTDLNGDESASETRASRQRKPRGQQGVKRTFDSTRKSGSAERDASDADKPAEVSEDGAEAPKRRGRPRKPEASTDETAASLPDFIKNPAASI